MHNLHLPSYVVSSLIALAACSGTGKPPPEVTEPGGSSPALESSIRAVMDPTADPCTDFYAYACGGWTASTTLPADRAIIVRGFTTIQDQNEVTLRDLLTAAAAAAPTSADPDVQKLGAYWTSCMDEAAIDARGAEPLKALLAEVDAVKDRAQFFGLSARFGMEGLGGLAGAFVDADAKNPDVWVLQLGQGGTGLPDRSYYLDPKNAEVLAAYHDHIVTLLGLAGESAEQAEADAATVIAFETELARAQWTPEQLRDANATYNKLDRKGLEAISPGLDWGAYLAGLGHPGLTQINVVAPSFFTDLAKVVSGSDLAVLRTYLRWRVVDGSANELSKPFDDEAFAFYGHTLFGQREQRPRWKRCVEATDRALGDVLAARYVDEVFKGDSKPVAEDMIHAIEAAFAAGLGGIAWMDDETRARAAEKVRAITNKIGYPEHFRTYPFDVAADDLFGNNRRANAADLAYWLDKVGQPIDPDNWLMTAPTVNAYYQPPQNEIVFPAGILQPPFFSVDYPKAMNFGGMGMVMGHEITHGFDDEGRKFDKDGMLTDWWTPSSVEKFEQAAACVDDQYDHYEIEPGTHLSGELTLGENIADLGGLRLAIRAYRAWTAEHGQEPEVAGMTGEQLLFLAHAQAWCSIATPEVARVRAATDPHAPPRFRVNGPISNLPEFAEAYQCQAGDAMVAAEPCQIW